MGDPPPCRLVSDINQICQIHQLHKQFLSPHPVSAPSSPVSASPVSADRYPLKITDCTDNALEGRGMQIPSEKTENRVKKAKPTAVSCGCFKVYYCSANPLQCCRKLADQSCTISFSLSQPKTPAVCQTHVRMAAPAWWLGSPSPVYARKAGKVPRAPRVSALPLLL